MRSDLIIPIPDWINLDHRIVLLRVVLPLSEVYDLPSALLVFKILCFQQQK